jgi:hypothetical protein
MNPHDEEQMKQLLKQTLPPMGDDAAAGRDLWPGLARRLQARPAAPPWFDWALAGALVLFVAVFPASIPVFLYYL